jgi:hypothetical protein
MLVILSKARQRMAVPDGRKVAIIAYPLAISEAQLFAYIIHGVYYSTNFHELTTNFSKI